MGYSVIAEMNKVDKAAWLHHQMKEVLGQSAQAVLILIYLFCSAYFALHMSGKLFVTKLHHKLLGFYLFIYFL
jgi:hypothetical protein